MQIAMKNEISKTRSKVALPFGFMGQSMKELYVRSIEIRRASGFACLINPSYNLYRNEQVIRLYGIRA